MAKRFLSAARKNRKNKLPIVYSFPSLEERERNDRRVKRICDQWIAEVMEEISRDGIEEERGEKE